MKDNVDSFKSIISKRVRAKQMSREEDERALASGEKTQEQIQKENGIFSFTNAKIIFDPKSI